MTMPNFLIIGANKAGTTSLYGYLTQHPQIYMSPVKEPTFFTLEGQEIEKTVDSKRPFLQQFVNNIGDYEALFKEVSNEKAIGEASTSYIADPYAPKRIKQYIPDVKLIAILRDPIERANSHYLMHLRWNLETNPDFAQAIKQLKEGSNSYLDYINSLRRWSYTGSGFYYTQLKRYLDLFDRNQLKIYLYENDWCDNPSKLVKDIFSFLEVDDNFIPDMSSKYNLTTNKKSLAESVRRELIEIYREEVLKLQDLTQRDLSKWLE